MKLSKINLSGFKSFVDPTTLPLQAHINGIVGPNGCGKSNVIDAVRWVMGESSASKLRGESSADVIFNGSAVRKPVGQAVVELIFDNSDQTLSGEYAQYAEISVKRQLSRDGQSHYYLNRTRCRRRDISTVFAGTGLGSRSYSIIEQGMVSRVIEAKPSELRIFFEEAAGVSIYRDRRKDTETRIRQTEENLARVDDLIHEQEKQLARLKRQSEAAAQYKTYQSEQIVLSQQLAALQLKAFNTIQAEQDQRLSTLGLRQTQNHTEKAQLMRQIEASQVQRVEKNDAYQSIQADFYNLGTQIAKTEQALEHQQLRQKELEADLEQVQAARDQNEQQQAQDTKALDSLSVELKQLEPDYFKADEMAQDLIGEHQALQAQLNVTHERWDALQITLQQTQAQTEAAKSTIEQLEKQTQPIQKRQADLAQEKQTFELTALESQHVQCARKQAEQEARASEMASVITLLDEQLSANRAEIQTQIQALNHLKESQQTLKTQQAALEALQQVALGQQSDALQTWLTEQGLEKNSILGECIEVKPGWECAVATVLGSYLAARCVESSDAMSTALSKMTEGEVVLFETQKNIEANTPKPRVGLETCLADQVVCDHNLKGLLAHVFTVENLAQALNYRACLKAHESIITASGIWLGANWVKVSRKQAATDDFFIREAELKTLAKTLQAQQTQIQTLDKKLSELQQVTITQEQSRQDQLEKQKQHIKALRETSNALSALETRLEHARNRLEQIDQETLNLSKQQQAITEQLTQQRGCLSEYVEQMATHHQAQRDLKAKRERLTLETEERLEAVHEQQALAHDLAMQKQSAQTKQQALEENLARIHAQQQTILERARRLKATIAEIEQPQQALQSNLKILLEKRIDLEGHLSKAKDALESEAEKLKQLEQARLVLDTKIDDNRAKIESHRLEQQSVLVRKEALLEQMPILKTATEYESIIKSLPEAANQTDWSKKVEKIEKKMKNLEPINLIAIEEYNTELERKEYLDTQQTDLSEALAILQKAIRKIDQQTREQFKKTFDTVNQNFQTLFPKLFGGGQAALTLMGEDILEAGVSVMAQPPGKKNTSIHLLSGGEKALTAIALVFSIFQLNPAPFCILDEVDAPLDDVNVVRFCDLVKELAQKLQFIVITHNKITMEIANYLSGVTMKEAGVSRLVSVNVDEAALMVEA